MTKKELRAAMKKRNLSLSSEERDAASERIFGRVEHFRVVVGTSREEGRHHQRQNTEK